MAIEFLPSVNLKVTPQILAALKLMESIWARYGYILVVTSANDLTHSPGSLHYKGEAVDLRSKGLPLNVKDAILNDLQRTFPTSQNWYAILEQRGGDNEHYHVQRGLAVRNKKTGAVIGYAMPTD